MSGLFFAFLFILQLVSFFLIAILNARLSKLQDVERKQQVLMKEMDDAVSAYLFEIKDENNRLLKELSRRPSSYEGIEVQSQSPQDELHFSSRSTVSKTKVANLYKQTLNIADSEVTTIPITLKEQVDNLYSQGKSIEQIAKQLEKGKTEIELMLKFRNE
jgi:hypothetical protein